MFYRLLGIAVWKGGNWLVRRHYGLTIPQGAAIAGTALFVLGAVVGARRGGRRSGQLTP